MKTTLFIAVIFLGTCFWFHKCPKQAKQFSTTVFQKVGL